MARCKDCIHYNICCLWATSDLDEEEAYKYCFGNFKDTADVVPKSEVEKILTEIKQAFETYGDTYGMKQRIAELMQEYGIKDCTDCGHFVGCETACGGRVCGEFKEKKK